MTTDRVTASAERWRNTHGFACSDIDECQDDIMTLAEYAVSRLDDDAAEHIERDKPIDAEWCVANGATKAEDGAFSLVPAQPHYAVKHHPLYSWASGSVRVDWDEASGVAIANSDGETVCLPFITTRGQLLDLLAALKGGGE